MYIISGTGLAVFLALKKLFLEGRPHVLFICINIITYKMRKKHKEQPRPQILNEGPTIKVGQEVLYMTPYVLDKTFVESINKETKMARLGNGIEVSRYYHSNGNLTGPNVNPSSLIRLWSEETNQLFEYQLAIRNIKNVSDKLVNLAQSSSKEVTINIYNKLNKIIKRYE